MNAHVSVGNNIVWCTETGKRCIDATRGRAAVVAGGAVLLGLLTGCGSASNTGVAAPSANTTVTNSSASQAQSDARPEHSARPASPGSRCRSGDLKANLVGGDRSAGHVRFQISVTNLSGHVCSLNGYPRLAFIDSAGVFGKGAVPIPGLTAKGVRLASGQQAAASLTFKDPAAVSGARSQRPLAVLVTLPGETSSIGADWVSQQPVPVSETVGVSPFSAK
ncbi:DUF4232 domain-containing protein [Streptomyces sp. NPDC088354]|uniref:DUF4232 domain-containing protein n=1 Tax=Streptomyces sp. NPDC088354 TaxID=3365856 RepID=UPI0037F27A56